MWFAFGFVASCAMFVYILPSHGIVPSVYATLAVTAALLLASIRWKQPRLPARIAVGCLLGFGWCLLFQQNYLTPAQTFDGREVDISITLTDYSQETAYGSRADGRLELEEKSYRVQVYLDEWELLSPGDIVQGSFLLRTTTPEGSKESTYHQGEGVFLLAYQRGDISVTHPKEMPLWTFPAQMRVKIQQILDSSFAGQIGAFAKALLLGDTSGLDYATDTELKLSGIRHVAAVSGLHVSIVFALISTVTFRKRWLKALLGFPALLLFASVAGFSPSVVRACVMSGMMLLASLSEREYDAPTALAFSLLLMLVVNPLAVTSVSLQLSALSVAGILSFQGRIQSWLLGFLPAVKQKGIAGRLLTWLTSSVSVSLSSMSFTTPFCAFYFGTVSLIGPLTNLLSLWIISFVFYGLMGVCILSLCWQTGASLLAWIISLPIRFVLGAAGLFGNLPMAAVYTQSNYIVLWLLLCYILLAVFLLQKEKRPGLLLSCATVSLCLALLASWIEPTQDDFRLTVLDVGQGQSILLQSEGRTFLVDCGGDSETKTADLIAGTLLSQGIDRLDGIILTHYDTDHAGALDELLARVETDLLLVPDTVDARPFPQVQGAVCYVDSDMKITLDSGCITIYGPIYSGSDNENSLCVLFEAENCAILITGDRSDFGERMLLRHTELPDVDVLIAGHHGAKSSTSEELLRAVTPETVIISAGEGNYYGHPHPELLSRLEEFGCTVYRTDLHGTVIYRR